MLMKLFVRILSVLAVTWIVNACAVNQAAVDSSKAALRTAIDSNERSIKMLQIVAGQSEQAYKEGKIAESANAEIQNYVLAEQKSIQIQNIILNKSLKDLETKGSINNESLERANQAIRENGNKMRILEEKTKVIVDFLGNETFSKSEIGALFKPGEYRLLADQQDEGKRLFSPIVEKLFSFADKYKGTFTNLKGEIIVTGYSDATPIDKRSRLYRELADFVGVSDPSSSMLNQKLSELRAVAVKELLEKIINHRKEVEGRKLDIKITVLGRGEDIPRGLPDNVPKNDFRRRVVTFYWVVLPVL